MISDPPQAVGEGLQMLRILRGEYYFYTTFNTTRTLLLHVKTWVFGI